MLQTLVCLDKYVYTGPSKTTEEHFLPFYHMHICFDHYCLHLPIGRNHIIYLAEDVTHKIGSILSVSNGFPFSRQPIGDKLVR